MNIEIANHPPNGKRCETTELMHYHAFCGIYFVVYSAWLSMANSSTDSVYLCRVSTSGNFHFISLFNVHWIPLRNYSSASAAFYWQIDLCLFQTNNAQYKCGRCDHKYFRWDLFDVRICTNSATTTVSGQQYPICIKLIRARSTILNSILWKPQIRD